MVSKLKFSFDNQEITAIANDLMMAAAVTTSYTTLWTLYLMATNPDEEQLQIPAKAKCRESMRLFPVAPFLTRILQKRIEIDGYTISEWNILQKLDYILC